MSAKLKKKKNQVHLFTKRGNKETEALKKTRETKCNLLDPCPLEVLLLDPLTSWWSTLVENSHLVTQSARSTRATSSSAVPFVD